MLWSSGQPQDKQEFSQKITKLYGACSIVNGFKGYDQVLLVWYCASRQTPIPSYDDLVTHYDQLEPDQKRNLRIYVDRLFFPKEYDQLKAFLFQVYKYNVMPIEEPVPIDTGKDISKYNVVVPPKAENTGWFKLAGKGAEALPFSAIAYYDLRKCPQSIELDMDDEDTMLIDRL